MFRLTKIASTFILVVSVISCQENLSKGTLSSVRQHSSIGREAKLWAIDLIPHENTLTAGKVPSHIVHAVNLMGLESDYVDRYTDYKLYLEFDGIVQLLSSGQYDHT